MNSQNIQKTDDRCISVTFQGQTIKAGTILYYYKYSAFVRVLSIVECNSPDICVVFEHGGAEFTIELNGDNFVSVPTHNECQVEKDAVDHAINTRNNYQIVDLYKGHANQVPSSDNRIAQDTQKAICRYIAESGLNPSDLFVINHIISGSGKTSIPVPVSAWLKVFFRDRIEKLEEAKEKAIEKINMRKAMKFLLEREYFSEFQKIDGINQHPEDLTFAGWLNERF